MFARPAPLFAPALILSVVGCGMLPTAGSGTAATETRDVGPFSEFAASAGVSVRFEVGPESSVTLTADDNLLPLIETRVVGDRLILRPTESVRAQTPVVVRLTAPSLAALLVTDDADATVNDLPGGKLTVDVAENGYASVGGSVAELQLGVGGSGEFDGSNLTAAFVGVGASDDATAAVSGTKLIVDAEGNAAVTAEVAGGGKITGGASDNAVITYTLGPGASADLRKTGNGATREG